MYVPAHFEESDPDRLHALIARHPFGILVTRGTSGLDANHLPFELEVRHGSLGVLHTHVARANPLWKDIASGDEVLVVFRAADAYISPNWYRANTNTTVRFPPGTTWWRTRTGA